LTNSVWGGLEQGIDKYPNKYEKMFSNFEAYHIAGGENGYF
jgi:hypothetical protein